MIYNPRNSTKVIRSKRQRHKGLRSCYGPRTIRELFINNILTYLPTYLLTYLTTSFLCDVTNKNTDLKTCVGDFLFPYPQFSPPPFRLRNYLPVVSWSTGVVSGPLRRQTQYTHTRTPSRDHPTSTGESNT